MSGLALHLKQLGILLHSLELLAPGGRLVYSAHSRSPIDDESDVAAVLTRLGPKVSIEVCADAAGKLGGSLPSWRGIQVWRVPHPAEYATNPSVCEEGGVAFSKRRLETPPKPLSPSLRKPETSCSSSASPPASPALLPSSLQNPGYLSCAILLFPYPENDVDKHLRGDLCSLRPHSFHDSTRTLSQSIPAPMAPA